jgi:molecular chaperone GrpE (heat shock protein)
MSDRTSTDKIQHERIFTNSELLVLEEQIKYLVTKQKDMKTFVKEEFKNFRSRLEKEIRDAQQEGKIDLAIT